MLGQDGWAKKATDDGGDYDEDDDDDDDDDGYDDDDDDDDGDVNQFINLLCKYMLRVQWERRRVQGRSRFSVIRTGRMLLIMMIIKSTICQTTL